MSPPPAAARSGGKAEAARGPEATQAHRRVSSDDEKTVLVGRDGADVSVVGVLVAVAGPLEGSAFTLRPGENEIGRGSGCTVVTPSEFISRRHCVVVHRDGGFQVCGLSEENPTILNGSPVPGPGSLADGDELRLGRTTFRFRTLV